MTRNTKIAGYTELDILMFQAGAPIRFDSPYWTKREVDWSVVKEIFIKPVLALVASIRKTLATTNRPNAIA